MSKIFKLISIVIMYVFLSGFVSSNSAQEDRDEILKMKKETLALLLKDNVEAQMLMNRAYGYAVFSNVGVNVILFSAEGGYGVAHNNLTGENIYMKMVSAGAGFGFGLKDFRAVFIFENRKVFENFVNYGWEANAQADVAVKAENKGAAVNAAITVAPGIKLYKITKNGVALQATIQGTKYWKDDRLNNE